jgi:predicted transcriptional regulator
MIYYGVMRKANQTTSIRLTPEAKRLLSRLAQKLGVTQAAIIEMAIRKFAEREGVNDQNNDHPVPAE